MTSPAPGPRIPEVNRELGLRDGCCDPTATSVTVSISTVPGKTKGEDLGILARLVADNRLRPQIGWTADWTRTADALAALAQRAFPGKTVLTVPHEA